MAKVTKEEYERIIAQKKALARMILDKIGLSYEDFVVEAEASLIREYSDLLTDKEREKYRIALQTIEKENC